jgi:hypothetical protein
MPSAPSSQSERTHPYSVRFVLVFGSNVDLEWTDNEIRVPFGGGGLLCIKKLKELPRNATQASIDLEAFASASEAERAGRLLAFSLMWLAASKQITIGFAKWTGTSPFAVRDRTRSDGLTAEAEGRGFFRMSPTELSDEVARAFGKNAALPDSLITSMQFYASARLESSEVARFIGLMTALEALAEQQEYDGAVETVLRELAMQLEQAPSLADPVNASLRSSLANQIRGLKRESVGRAIRRTVNGHIQDAETLKFVEESYAVRSKMLHEGMRAADLAERINRMERLMRSIYASITGLSLSR